MSLPLNLLMPTAATTGSAADAAGLTEAELLACYPVLAVAAGILLALGLACDSYLIFRLTRAYPSSTTGGSKIGRAHV